MKIDENRCYFCEKRHKSSKIAEKTKKKQKKRWKNEKKEEEIRKIRKNKQKKKKKNKKKKREKEEEEEKKEKQTLYIQTPDQPPHGGVNVSSSSSSSLREFAWSIRTSSCGPAREGTPPNGVGWHLKIGQGRASPGKTGQTAGSMV